MGIWGRKGGYGRSGRDVRNLREFFTKVEKVGKCVIMDSAVLCASTFGFCRWLGRLYLEWTAGTRLWGAGG